LGGQAPAEGFYLGAGAGVCSWSHEGWVGHSLSSILLSKFTVIDTFKLIHPNNIFNISVPFANSLSLNVMW